MRTAALALALAVPGAAALAVPAPAGAREPVPRIAPPVPGGIARAFAYAGDPFARGHHRGLDLAAAAGAPVRAACSGRVTFAGNAGATGRAVTIRCGVWSVTHLPLRGLVARAGETVPAGAPLGELAASREHAGLHLGVRRAADPLGYVDPAPLLRAPAPPGPAAPPPRPISRPPHPPPLAGRGAPPAQTAPAAAPARPGPSPLAPWPAWAGLALLLAGAAGAGSATAVRARRRRRAPLVPALRRGSR